MWQQHSHLFQQGVQLRCTLLCTLINCSCVQISFSQKVIYRPQINSTGIKAQTNRQNTSNNIGPVWRPGFSCDLWCWCIVSDPRPLCCLSSYCSLFCQELIKAPAWCCKHWAARGDDRNTTVAPVLLEPGINVAFLCGGRHWQCYVVRCRQLCVLPELAAVERPSGCINAGQCPHKKSSCEARLLCTGTVMR